jgi:signal transduction histidine kinase
MPSPHSVETANGLNTRLMLSQFEIGDPAQIVAHSEVIIPRPYTRQSRSLLRTQIGALVTADRRKDESMALLLHELRSPLASIQNAVAVLRIRSKDEALQQRMHELIERQVRQIALLTSNLSQSSGSGLEHLRLQLERIDLRTVLTRAAPPKLPIGCINSWLNCRNPVPGFAGIRAGLSRCL